MDGLFGELIGLARAARDNGARVTEDTVRLIRQSLLTFEDEAMQAMRSELHAEKARLAPDCAECEHPCWKTADYAAEELLLESLEARQLKEKAAMLLLQAAENEDEAAFYIDGLNLIGDLWHEEKLREKVAKMHMRVIGNAAK